MNLIGKDLLAIEQTRVRAGWWLLGVIAATVVGGLYGADQVRMPISIQAPGVVIAPSRVQAVGSSEGGLVSKVLVRPFDHVEAGQSLVELDSAFADADSNRLAYAHAAARADVIRLEAELNGTTPDFSGLPEDLARSAQEAWKVRVQKRSDEIAVKNAELAAQTNALVSFRTSLYAGDAVLRRLEEGAAMGVVPRNRADDQLRQVEDMRGRVTKGVADVAGATAQIAALKGNQMEAIAKDLSEARSKTHEAEQQLGKAQAQERHMVLRAPVAGRVKTLTVHGPNMAVKPGEMVAEIIEDGHEMRVEARLPASDRGHVVVGAPARILLASDDGSHEGIEGKVLSVAPDAVADNNGHRTYGVEIAFDPKFFPGRAGVPSYALSDGVEVNVFQSYGERTLLQFVGGRFLGQRDTWLEGR